MRCWRHVWCGFSRDQLVDIFWQIFACNLCHYVIIIRKYVTISLCRRCHGWLWDESGDVLLFESILNTTRHSCIKTQTMLKSEASVRRFVFGRASACLCDPWVFVMACMHGFTHGLPWPVPIEGSAPELWQLGLEASTSSSRRLGCGRMCVI